MSHAAGPRVRARAKAERSTGRRKRSSAARHLHERERRGAEAEHRKQMQQEGQDEVHAGRKRNTAAHARTRKLQDLLRRATRPKIVAAGRAGLGENVRAPLAHPARQVAHIAVADGRAAARRCAPEEPEPSQSDAHAARSSDARHPLSLTEFPSHATVR